METLKKEAYLFYEVNQGMMEGFKLYYQSKQQDLILKQAAEEIMNEIIIPIKKSSMEVIKNNNKLSIKFKQISKKSSLTKASVQSPSALSVKKCESKFSLLKES